MQFSLKVVDKTLVATLEGELDLHKSPEFKEKITMLFNQHPEIRYLIMDVERMTFIDSSGLGVILGRFKELQTRGGKLYFVNANPRIRRILQLSGFERISSFKKSTDEVLSQVRGAK